MMPDSALRAVDDLLQVLAAPRLVEHRAARASRARPSRPFSGVRISWLVLARKALLARLAASASSRARGQRLLDAAPLGHVLGDPDRAAVGSGGSGRPPAPSRRHKKVLPSRRAIGARSRPARRAPAAGPAQRPISAVVRRRWARPPRRAGRRSCRPASRTSARSAGWPARSGGRASARCRSRRAPGSPRAPAARARLAVTSRALMHQVVAPVHREARAPTPASSSARPSRRRMRAGSRVDACRRASSAATQTARGRRRRARCRARRRCGRSPRRRCSR